MEKHKRQCKRRHFLPDSYKLRNKHVIPLQISYPVITKLSGFMAFIVQWKQGEWENKKCRQVFFFFFSFFEWRLPREVWPVSIKVVTSGCHVELDLVEFIKIVDDVGSEVGFEEGTPGVIPVTTWKTNKLLIDKQTTGRFILIRRQLCFFFMLLILNGPKLMFCSLLHLVFCT